MDVKIDTTWRDKLQEEFEKPYFCALTDFVREEYRFEPYLSSCKTHFQCFRSMSV